MTQDSNQNNLAESTNDDVSSYLDDYVRQPNPQYSVMLDGEWGSGKTFFIKNEIEEWKILDNDPVRDDELELKPIYVSLYGLKSINQLVQKIKEEISPILYSKQAKILKNIGLGLLKATAKIDLKTDDENASLNAQFDFLSLLKSNNDSIKGEKILVFDDLERSEIPLNQLFGFVNEFLEHNRCKVILITDEDKLKKLYPTSDNKESKSKKSSYKLEYSNFKEKLVGQTFKIKADYRNAINCFIENDSYKQEQVLKENKNDILEVFRQSSSENLRILKKFFSDFDRFISPIEDNYYDNKNLERIKKPSLICLLIMTLESKSGNLEVDKLSSYIDEISTGFEIFSEQDETQKLFKSRYKNLIEKHNLSLLKSFYEEKVFARFLKTSSTKFIDNKLDYNIKLILEDKKNEFVLLKQLKEWKVIDNKDFRKISDELKSKLENKEFDNIRLLVDLHNTFQKLINMNLLNFSYLDKKIIDNVDSIISDKGYVDNINESIYTTKIYDSNESSEIAMEINERINKHQVKIIKELKVDIVEKIDNGNVKEFKDRIESEPHSPSNSIWSGNIFQNINLSNFTDNFLNLTPEQRFELIHFLKNNRYNSKAFNHESKNLRVFVDNLQKKVDCYNSIEKYQIEDYIKELNQTIKSLND